MEMGGIGRGCLTARRLVEKVCGSCRSFMPGGITMRTSWATSIPPATWTSRSPRLVQDLKDRGLLNETFGSRRERVRAHACHQSRRVPLGPQRPGSQHLRLHRVDGRWGREPGAIYGATDDFGFKVAENPVHVHDLHAQPCTYSEWITKN
jgi:hypothetical protein